MVDRVEHMFDDGAVVPFVSDVVTGRGDCRQEVDVVVTIDRSVPGGAVGAPAAARQLVRRAGLELDAAAASEDPQMRFLHAHMAAIRAASAVLALTVTTPPARRRRVLSVWEQLADAGAEWVPWAAQFAAAAPTRAAIEAGRVAELPEPVAAEALDVASAFADEVGAAVATAGRVPATALAS